jgi:Mn2+/Fe2+ NRAMP family transporter
LSNDIPTTSPTRPKWRDAFGPGFVVAATGVGAGDLIAASVAGQRYGLGVLWIVAVGALLKWVLNDGVARWQFATGTTLIAGWTQRLPRVVGWYFLGYLVLWGFLVAAALGAACGVAARALWPVLPTAGWAVIHALAGLALVWSGRYRLFETIMQALMAAMFVIVVACALPLGPDPWAFLRGLVIPTAPEGSARFLLGVMGGVGGSVTLLCYGYWIRERGWSGATAHRRAQLDLGVAYFLTGLFGLAMIVIAAEAKPADASGHALVLALSARLGELLGPAGRLCFLIGFWCAVFTSLLGVWQGVPYLFSDTIAQVRRRLDQRVSAPPISLTQSRTYRGFLLFLALPPLLLHHFQRPLTLVVLYAIAGAFFMPFLASVLLVMNNRSHWVGALKNKAWIKGLVILSLLECEGRFAIECAAILAGRPGVGGG